MRQIDILLTGTLAGGHDSFLHDDLRVVFPRVEMVVSAAAARRAPVGLRGLGAARDVGPGAVPPAARRSADRSRACHDDPGGRRCRGQAPRVARRRGRLHRRPDRPEHRARSRAVGPVAGPRGPGPHAEAGRPDAGPGGLAGALEGQARPAHAQRVPPAALPDGTAWPRLFPHAADRRAGQAWPAYRRTHRGRLGQPPCAAPCAKWARAIRCGPSVRWATSSTGREASSPRKKTGRSRRSGPPFFRIVRPGQAIRTWPRHADRWCAAWSGTM